MSIDAVLASIQKQYEDRLELVVSNELRKELDKLGKRLRGIIKNEWNTYLNSYSPTVYSRTGATMQSIQFNGVSGSLESGMEARVSYGVNAMDTYLRTPRNTFQAIDEGWGNGKGKYRYHYYGGYGMTPRIKQQITSELPSYIDLEMG